jgi:hypothetical protein
METRVNKRSPQTVSNWIETFSDKIGQPKYVHLRESCKLADLRFSL